MCFSNKLVLTTLSLFASISSLVAWAGATDPVSSLEVKVPILVESKQMTVYVFDNDTTGVSNCYNGCANAWPAVLHPGGGSVSAPYSLVTRKDGSSQLAYAGKPLYTYTGDSNPGDITGNGLGGIWHVVASPSGN
jgi:predicted lipoprotein with Yx(FWY)xxD motif